MPSNIKFDPFKPQQPTIPGVPQKVEEPVAVQQQSGNHSGATLSRAASPGSNSLWLGLAAVVVVAIVVVGWLAHTSSKKEGVEAPAAEEIPSAPSPVKPAEKLPVGPGEIAHAPELAKTWSSKRFLFRDPTTSDETEALAVRLPGSDLWGISLRDSYGTCELEYVTNLETLRSQYHFPAEHPMVVNPCTKAIFDLALYGRGPHGLVRGEIVRGKAVRPPIGIEIVARGSRIIAVRME
jgi:hypothetical protein